MPPVVLATVILPVVKELHNTSTLDKERAVSCLHLRRDDRAQQIKSPALARHCGCPHGQCPSGSKSDPNVPHRQPAMTKLGWQCLLLDLVSDRQGAADQRRWLRFCAAQAWDGDGSGAHSWIVSAENQKTQL